MIIVSSRSDAKAVSFCIFIITFVVFFVTNDNDAKTFDFYVTAGLGTRYARTTSPFTRANYSSRTVLLLETARALHREHELVVSSDLQRKGRMLQRTRSTSTHGPRNCNIIICYYIRFIVGRSTYTSQCVRSRYAIIWFSRLFPYPVRGERLLQRRTPPTFL